jgi:hypothetical protein
MTIKHIKTRLMVYSNIYVQREIYSCNTCNKEDLKSMIDLCLKEPETEEQMKLKLAEGRK